MKKILGFILAILLGIGIGVGEAAEKYVLVPMGGPNWSAFDPAYIQVSDDFWLGLGAAKCRIVFNDTTADELQILDCITQFGTATGAAQVNITPVSAIDALFIKTQEAAGGTDAINIDDSNDVEIYAVDSDGNVEATSYTADATSAPSMSLTDSDAAAATPPVMAKIYGNLTNTGDGTEVGDLYFQAMSAQGGAGSLETAFWWDGSAESLVVANQLRVIGNNSAVELEDDSGNISRIESGNSQLTISADPDNVVASTNMVFEIDGVEVGRFQQSLGFQSVKGFATQLWDIVGANWETAVINTEYYSPNQCGGIYGTIYRQYFNTVLTSTNPRLDQGSIVTKMVDYVLHTKYTGTDRGVGHGNMTAYGTSTDHAYLMLSGASGGGNLSLSLTGYTVITGWVDYTK